MESLKNKDNHNLNVEIDEGASKSDCFVYVILSDIMNRLAFLERNIKQ